MTIHISARVAWHDHGWNGCVCRNPKGNTYCVGQFSFPGELIAERRNLELEETLKGKPAGEEPGFFIPCLASVNAFGPAPIPAQMPPPKWFTDKTSSRTWIIPPYTI